MSNKKTGEINTDLSPNLVTVSSPADAGTVPASQNKEAIVVKPPNDGEMKEVSAKEFASRRAPVHGASTNALAATINGLIGLPLPEVRAKLEELKSQRLIKGFRVIPMGMPLTSEVIQGRVSVIKDHADNVLDIVVG